MRQATERHISQWEKEGYLIVDRAFKGSDLLRLQAAFDRCAAEAKPEWLDAVEAGTRPAAYFDIPDPLQKDDAFLALADHPSYFGLLLDLLGEDLFFEGAQVRTVPLSPISYIGWHPDIEYDQPPHIKVQIYVETVPAEGGAFAFVPGSHKADSGPYPNCERLEEMPGHKVFPGTAGTAIVFNNYGWHTSMINRTDKPRKSIILSYGERDYRSQARKADLKKKGDPHLKIKNPDRHQVIDARITSSHRRKLFGLQS